MPPCADAWRMDDVLELLPNAIVALILGPFVVGVVLLAVLVQPTPSGRTAVYLLAAGGAVVFVTLAGAMALLLRQDRGLDVRRGPGE